MVVTKNLWLYIEDKPVYDPVFANNTWEEIATACQLNTVPDSWAVGDKKTMTIDGTDYAIDIIGKNHDDYSDGSGKAPLTFQLHDCLSTKYPMHSTNTNTVGWSGSTMRTETLTSVLATMPQRVQLNIRKVTKVTKDVHTVDNLFLLSEIEVFGNTTNSAIGEGTQYEYYKNGGSTKKTSNGTATAWCERSPYKMNTSYFDCVDATGKQSNSYASTKYGVSFAFCF